MSCNTNELVAIYTSTFEEVVLLNDLEELNKNDGEKDAEIKLTGAAKNFLVFIATTWTVKGKIQLE